VGRLDEFIAVELASKTASVRFFVVQGRQRGLGHIAVELHVEHHPGSIFGYSFINSHTKLLWSFT